MNKKKIASVAITLALLANQTLADQNLPFPGNDFDLYGVQLNYPLKTPWPRLNQQIVRLWDTSTDDHVNMTHWRDLNYANGVINYTNSYITIVNNYISHGIRSFEFSLGATPTWASTGSNNYAAYPPSNVSYYTNFVANLVQENESLCPSVKTSNSNTPICTWRYGSWNEPNGVFWISTDNKNGLIVGNTMANMVRLFYPIVKQYSPHAIVGSGEPTSISKLSWTNDWFKNGLGAYMDEFWYHCYPDSSHYPNTSVEQILYDANYLKYILSDYGYANVSISCTEGSSTDASGYGELNWAALYYIFGSSLNEKVMQWYAHDNIYNYGRTELPNANNLNFQLSKAGTYLAWSQRQASSIVNWNSPIKRMANTNTIRNLNFSGVVLNSTTPPTNYGVYSPDANVTYQFVNSGTDANGKTFLDVRIYGKPAAGNTGGQFQLFLEGSKQIPASVGDRWYFDLGVTVVAGSLDNLNDNSPLRIGFNVNYANGSFLTGSKSVAIYDSAINTIPSSHIYTVFDDISNTSATYVRPYISISYPVGANSVNSFDVTFRISSPNFDNGEIFSGSYTTQAFGNAMIYFDPTKKTTTISVNNSIYKYAWNPDNQIFPIGNTITVSNSVPIVITEKQPKFIVLH
jgi:hypothetical protein